VASEAALLGNDLDLDEVESHGLRVEPVRLLDVLHGQRDVTHSHVAFSISISPCAISSFRSEIRPQFRIQSGEEELRVIEEMRAAVGPYYLYIKAIHVFSAGLWSFSTAVAWAFYLKPALLAARRNPEDPVLRGRRDELMRRFDKGAAIEHVAFGFLVLTALLMVWIGRVDLGQWSTITVLLWIGILVILPMEAFDIYLSHLGGNKTRLRALGDTEGYERAMDWHWKFLRITEPLVIVLVPTMFLVAIVKPF
jgi:hypothetical protein